MFSEVALKREKVPYRQKNIPKYTKIDFSEFPMCVITETNFHFTKSRFQIICVENINNFIFRNCIIELSEVYKNCLENF